MPNHRVKKHSFCQLTHQLNVDLLNENIQVDLGGGVQLPLIGEDGSGLLELGQLGALHSYAYTPSEDQGMRSIAAAGAITEDGSIAVDPTGDEGNPARVNLTALFDQLDVEGLTDEVVDAAALEVGALASRAEHNDGELVRNYQLAGAELVFSSPLVGAFTDDLEGVTSGLGEALEESLGSTGALGDVTEALEVINLDLGVLTAGVEESSIAIDGLDEALAELNDRTLQGTVSSDTGLVEVNLETGEITVDLEQVMTGGLNDQDPNTSLLDATTIERITDELATVLGNVVTDLRDDLIATLDEIDLTINLDLTLEAALIDLADGGATVNGSLASFLGLVDESPAITSDLDLLGLLPLGELLTPLLNQVVGVLGNVVGGTVNPIIDQLGDATSGLLGDLLGTLDPVLEGVLSQLVQVTINEQGETVLSNNDAQYVSALSVSLLPQPDGTDAANLSLATSTVRALDQQPVVITSPEEGETIVGDTVEVTGTGEPGAEITATLGDQNENATVDGEGNWSAEFSEVEPGDYTAEATDGNTTDSVAFTVEAASVDTPVVTVDPDTAQIGEEVTVAGEGFAPESAMTINVTNADDGTVGTIEGVETDENGNFSAPWTVADEVTAGALTVTATDAEDNSAEATLTVTEPTVADVEITSPEEGDTITGDTVEVTGTGEPEAEITVTLGEQNETATVDGDGNWSTEFTEVEPGDYTIEATDGNTTDSVDITVEAAPVYEPVVTVEPDSAQAGDEVTVEGEDFVPGSTVTVVVTDEDGNEVGEPLEGVEVDDEGNFSTTWTVPEDVDPGQLTVEASDEEGNTGSTELTIEEAVGYDPELSVDPDEAEIGQEVTIYGSGYAPNSNIDLDVNPSIEGVSSDDEGAFEVTWVVSDELEVGEDYTIVGVDELGNEATTTLTVIDSTADDGDDADSGPSLNVDPEDVVPGEDVNIEGEDFGPEESVTIEITDEDGNVIDTVTVVTDGDGNFSVTWTVPADAGEGVLTLTASDESGNTASAELTISAAAAGAGATDSDGDLASTGATATLIATAVAILLIVIGAALMIARRQSKVNELS